MKSSDVSAEDQELEICTATYGRPEIGQSQQAKSVRHIIKLLIKRKGLFGKYQTSVMTQQAYSKASVQNRLKIRG